MCKYALSDFPLTPCNPTIIGNNLLVQCGRLCWQFITIGNNLVILLSSRRGSKRCLVKFTENSHQLKKIYLHEGSFSAGHKDTPYLNKETPGLRLTFFLFISQVFSLHFLHFKLCESPRKSVNKG